MWSRQLGCPGGKTYHAQEKAKGEHERQTTQCFPSTVTGAAPRKPLLRQGPCFTPQLDVSVGAKPNHHKEN